MESNIYYIKGNNKYPEKVKEALIKAGAKHCLNDYNYTSQAIYYINYTNGNVNIAWPDEFLYQLLMRGGTELFVEPEYKYNIGDTVKFNNELVSIKNRYQKQGKLYYKLFGGLPDTSEEELQVACTLKPFDKVLCRDLNTDNWTIDLFKRFTHNSIYHYQGLMYNWIQCIPYEGNEHLFGTDKEL